MKDLKYLFAYIVPLLALIGLLAQGWWSYLLVIFVFGVVPFIEPLLSGSEENMSIEEKESQLSKKFFDYLLYFNVVIVYGILGLFIYTLNTADLSTFELIGSTLSVGIVLGACGINVAHELGHRRNIWENRMAQALLLPNLYMHFFIEHNQGHHKNVATDLDPASAKYNEIVYTFWIRSVVGSYLSAWNIEKKRLQRKKQSFWSFNNQMLGFQITQIAYLVLLFFLTTTTGFWAVIIAGVIGFLLLETINYVEHYGLRRKQLESGRYEKVRPIHSWNSNFEVGRILLYELTRHSDHHYLASKKYQVLDHHDESPQLPLGYPGSILMALIPPLWFGVMNKRVKQHNVALT